MKQKKVTMKLKDALALAKNRDSNPYYNEYRNKNYDYSWRFHTWLHRGAYLRENLVINKQTDAIYFTTYFELYKLKGDQT